MQLTHQRPSANPGIAQKRHRHRQKMALLKIANNPGIANQECARCQKLSCPVTEIVTNSQQSHIIPHNPHIAEVIVIVECPRCGAEQEDFDGFGVMFCEVCGYCQHPSFYDGLAALRQAGSGRKAVRTYFDRRS